MRARQKVSRAGVELIKSFEGLRQTAARLPDGRWTIGYGHTFSAREGARVTQEDADALLRFDLLPIVDSLNNMILVPLNQNQFDALVSFSFNIGIENFGSSSVLKRINEGRMTEAALAMDAWRSAEFNGQTYVLAPLIRRRAAEKNLFLTPEDTAGNAPSLLVRPLADVEADAASARPSEVDAPDRGGILSAYPAGEPHAAAQPGPYAFAPQPAAPQPVAPQSVAPQPAAPEPASFQPAVAPASPVEPQPAASSPVAPQSPYAASSYAADTPVAPAMPLSPYAGTYTPPVAPQPVTAPAPAQPAVTPPVPYERQFIDLTSVTPRPLLEAVPVQAAPQVPPPSEALPPQALPPQTLSPQALSPEPPTPQPAAPVLQPSDISPYPPIVSPYASPYSQVPPQAPVPQALTPQSVAPQASTAFQPVAEPPVVEMLPGGYAVPSQIRETPVPEPAAPTSFDPAFGAAVMSPEVAAALARAQDEQRQRDEAERVAQQAAARAAEEVRIRELQRQEAERLEQQRQEQDRIERARFEAERQERERAEQARLELQRQEFERQEFDRQARERAEQARLEQGRLEQARLEQERVERESAEQARVEAERQARERAERARLEQESVTLAAAATVAVAAAPAVDEAAEKARKAEAAAALMRLYSPYGGGPLGRPLGAPLVAAPPAGVSEAVSGPKPEAPQAAEPEPEAAKLPVEEFLTQGVAAAGPVMPAAAVEDDSVPIFSTRVAARDDSNDDVSGFRPFTPIMSAANLPAPIVTAMNPYASPLPETAVREATETVVEVPRPQPVAESVRTEVVEPVSGPADDGLHWRDRLQRPLPADHQPAAPDFSTPERQASLLPKAAYAGEYDDAQNDVHGGGEAWLHDGRIAMSSEDGEAHHVSWVGMFLSTIWWILISIVGIISLGVAAGAYYKSKDLSVIRDGLQPDLAAVSIVTAVIGFVLVSISMWLMMRRLGGLKE